MFPRVIRWKRRSEVRLFKRLYRRRVRKKRRGRRRRKEKRKRVGRRGRESRQKNSKKRSFTSLIPRTSLLTCHSPLNKR
jgi:hypothetical protein